MKIKYLVCGTGRCGTNYMARFLTHAGIHCGHESIFDFNGYEEALKKLNGLKEIKTSKISTLEWTSGKFYDPNWFNPEKIQAECSYLAAPFLNRKELKDIKLVHLIRNPMQVLRSFHKDINFFDPNNFKNGINNYRNFVIRHFPEINDEKSLIERSCRYIIKWNRAIERSNLEKIKVRLEDHPYPEMVNFLGIDSNCCMPNEKINSWRKVLGIHTVSLEEVPEGETKKEFIDFIKENGYDLSC